MKLNLMSDMFGTDPTLSELLIGSTQTQRSRWRVNAGLNDFIPLGCKIATHHAEMNELLIGRNLDWVEDVGVFREEATPYRVVPSEFSKKKPVSKRRK